MTRLRIFCLASLIPLFIGVDEANSAELEIITPENYERIVPKGKEVDAIYGDWILRNSEIVAVIANPTPGRKANMTVRGVGGMVIDLTRRNRNSDQLGCFYPGGGSYLFEDSESFKLVVDGKQLSKLSELKRLSTKKITISLIGESVSRDGTMATLSYTLADGVDHLDYSVTINNQADEPRELEISDSIRCDGNLFRKDVTEGGKLFLAEDQYFGQAYGVRIDGETLKQSGGRTVQLTAVGKEKQSVAPGESLTWSGKLSCSQGAPGLRAWSRELEASSDGQRLRQKLMMKFTSPHGPVEHAKTLIVDSSGDELGTLQADAKGMLYSELLPGNYLAKIEAHGHADREYEFEIEDNARADTLSFDSAARVRAQVTDQDGKPIAAKVQFAGIEGTPTPDFGPDSAIAAMKDVVYCARGKFERPIAPGKYQVIISHGPEYDAEYREIEVQAGRISQLTVSLPRVVDTTGWVSAEFHSHSSPSGDNVSHQSGRVLNLLAEHLEFSPCTEHNRVDTYADDLELFGATAQMATCTGMELTGSPLPINHQNAFPIHRHEHEQDGGGPQTDANPVKQIERLAMWDNTSSKVVQSNHPNIPSILGDRDLNNIPDAGFRGMLGWMDVIEVHPPQGIFDFPKQDVSADDKFGNPIFFWLQLLNLGYRIPGVVNTDAHYNYHGSGWLRNYLESSTDDPAEISLAEMIHSAEHGHMVMTTGPFLQVEIRKPDGKVYTCGDDVTIEQKGGRLWIQVQCPNWFDINRVQVFSNGEPLEDLNFTRKSHPKLFSDQTVRFRYEAVFPKPVIDTHIVVAAIGEGLKLGPVMGPEQGELPPVAVSNPIFLDVDGGGFQSNGDDLGVPFTLPPIESVTR